MTRNELNRKYFNWMYQLVCNEKHFINPSYFKLLYHLHNTDFTYIIEMDGNRAEDGMDLRYQFGYERESDNIPCSVLEMMIALTIRCEEHIMINPDIGNRTGEWFWGMIENLGLIEMNDVNYNQKYVANIISKFLKREYKRNGVGGLFRVNNCKYDLRTVEIWYQMCWYLANILQEE